LGDSQFVVIRNSEVLLESKEQQVKFNMPYQMGTRSDITPATHAEVYSLQVQPNDYIIMGTDGLFDNVFTKTMVNAVKRGKAPRDVARQLAMKAFEDSKRRNFKSPFEKLAKLHNEKWTGGKSDDITVIVAKVKPKPNP